MKNIIKKQFLFLLTIALISGCTGSFDEINTDPDAYDDVPNTNVLAYVFRTTAEQFGGDIGGYGTFAGYIVKIQYMEYYSGYTPNDNTYGNRWYQCYMNNSQINTILKKTEENAEALKNIRWVCRIWQNYMWQYLTDGWRDIPYFDALKGAEDDGNVWTQKFDTQEEVYPAVMASLKQIADEMAEGFGDDPVGEGDFIYSGNMSKWQKFCNSLRLRMAMRISEVSPELSRSTIEEIAGNPTRYPIMESNADQCYFWWQGTPPYYERWYNDQLDRDDYGMFEIFIDHMKEMDDPRLASIAHPAESDGEYRGFINGAPGNPTLNTISRIGEIYRDDPGGFTPLYKACEVYYILAEAAVRGWNVGMSAEEAYEKAVRLSMEDNGISTADTDAYLAGKGKWDNTKERIWWDEWVALFKDNFEAWCLYRRTGVPTTNYPSLGSIYGSAHNTPPYRIPYSANQHNFNPDELEKVKDNVVDNGWGQQMWWDTRTGIY